jgi:glutamate racemase
MSMRAIGVFDSGIGGLSILREIRRLLPHEDVLYFADQAHVPYGRRSMQQIRAFSEGITRFLLEQRVKLIVIACNTASAAALHHLRATFPDTPFVGMEPAVKPAAERTITGRIGVLATSATFQGELYASLLERFAEGKIVLQQTPHGLVESIEKGDLDSAESEHRCPGVGMHALSIRDPIDLRVGRPGCDGDRSSLWGGSMDGAASGAV